MPRILYAVLLLLPLLASAQGQWKWRDAQGNVQYSDRPPPVGTPDKDILSRPAVALKPRPVQVMAVGQAASVPAAPAPAASTAVERLAASEKAKQAREEETKRKTEEQRNQQIRADNCRAAKEQLATLESGLRVARANSKGEREVLDDTQRSELVHKARQTVAAECK